MERRPLQMPQRPVVVVPVTKSVNRMPRFHGHLGEEKMSSSASESTTLRSWTRNETKVAA